MQNVKEQSLLGLSPKIMTLIAIVWHRFKRLFVRKIIFDCAPIRGVLGPVSWNFSGGKSLCISNRNTFQALKLGSYFFFPYIWNILKEQQADHGFMCSFSGPISYTVFRETVPWSFSPIWLALFWRQVYTKPWLFDDWLSNAKLGRSRKSLQNKKIIKYY